MAGLGPRDPDTLVVEGNLATAYLRTGRQDGGLDLLGRNLAAREQVLGADHPATLTAADAMACARRLAGRPAAAVRAHLSVVARRLRVLGRGHPDLLVSQAGLALAAADYGDLTGAVEILDGAVADAEHHLDRLHPLLVHLHQTHAGLVEAGRRRAAREALDRAVTAAEHLWGAEAPETSRLRADRDELAVR